MTVCVLTGDRLRHRWLASGIVERFPGTRVVIERFHEETGANYTNDDVSPLMGDHFRRFDQTERAFFAESVERSSAALEDATLLEVPVGGINDPEVCDRIMAIEPTVIVVYSTSIIKDPLLTAGKGRLVNLHAGLSPYYRGAGTNLFPFYNDELELVGMTVHHLDAGIDSGAIIHQGRPGWHLDDDTHTIGCRCVELGLELMTTVVQRLLQGERPPAVDQDLSRGRLYRKRDFTDEVLMKIHEQIADGMVRRHASSPAPDVALVAW